MAAIDDLKREKRKAIWPLLLVFAALAAVISLAARWRLRTGENEHLRQQTEQLQAIAGLKAEEIRGWLKEHRGNASLVARNPLIGDELAPLLTGRPRALAESGLRAWMRALLDSYQYANALLLDRRGDVLLAAVPEDAAVGRETRELMERARLSRRVEISDLQVTPQGDRIHMDIAAPVNSSGEAVGFIVLRIDPQTFLFPLIRSWPTPSPSGETLLVRRDGADVLFLNELRHRKGTAMKLRLPLSSEALPAALAVRGKRGVVAGRDYRGIPVWSVVRDVPGTGWFIVAKVDEREILAPLRREAGATWMATLALLAAAAAMILFIWQRQAGRLAERRLEAESRQWALERHYDYLTRYANDIILLSDERWRILQANERAAKAYGYDRESLLTMAIPDLRAPQERGKIVAQYSEKNLLSGAVFETLHLRQDGSTFPVEVSARLIEVEGKKYFQSIARDITDRRRTEEEMRSARAFLEKVIDMSPFALWIADADGTVRRVNRALCDAIRLDPERIVGRYNVLQDANLEKQGVMPLVRGVFARLEPARFTIPWQAAEAGVADFQGARDMHIDVSMFPIAAPDGKLGHVVCQWIDITAQKQAVEELKLAYERLRRFIDANIVGVVIAAVDGRIIEANDYYLDMIGQSRAEFERGDVDWRRITPSEWLAADERAIRELRESGRCTPYEKEYLRPDGTRVPVLLADALLPGPEGQIAAFVLDLSEQKRAQAALRESDERYRRTLDNMLEGCQIIGSDWRYRYVNDAAARHGHLAKEGLLGRAMMEIYPGIEGTDMFRALERCMKERLPQQLENEFTYPDGGREWFELSMQPVPEGVFILSIDISARKRTEEALQALSARNEALLAAVPEIIMEVGTDKIYRWANPAGLAFFGDDVIGRPADSYFAGEQNTFQTVQPLFNGKEDVIYVESWQRRRDGAKRLLGWWCRVLKDGEGKAIGALSSAHDLTDIYRAGEELRASEEKFRQVFEASNIGKSLTLPGGEVVPNRALCDMLGYSPGELQKLRWQDITPADDVPATERILKTILSGEQNAARFMKRYLRKDGSLIWGDVSVTVRRDTDGKPLHLITTVVDITERVRAEEEIKKINQELEERVRQRTSQLEAANKELEAFSYSVSHDLRAPLRAIAGFGKILQEENAAQLDGEGRRILGIIIANTGKMGHLIDDLLAFSRLSRQGLAMTEVDLAALARDAFRELKPQEGERKIEFKVGGLPCARGDRAMLNQALQNLLANAIKFTRPRRIARIELGGGREGAENVYFVRDNGVGFEMEYADKLFGVFQRLHSSGEFEGTGVGLAIVQRIVARHGGRVWAEGRPGQGATFYFALPAAAGEPGERE